MYDFVLIYQENIKRSQAISPSIRRDRVLDSIPFYEKEQLLSENVQIEVIQLVLFALEISGA